VKVEVGDYLQTVASRVRKLRLLRNISQREMAQRIELSLRAYQGFEATGNIALNNFVRILAIFDRKGALLDVLTNTSSFRTFGDNKERRHKLTL
jgi:transcriptional regulator with XRE-family HTH domain